MNEEEKQKIIEQDKEKMKVLAEEAMEEKREEIEQNDKRIMNEKALQAKHELKQEELNEVFAFEEKEVEEEFNEKENIIKNNNINNNLKNKIKTKKKIIFTMCLAIVFIVLLLPIIVFKISNRSDDKQYIMKEDIQKNGTSRLTRQQKNFIGINSNNKELPKKEEKITDDYKKYLKLSEEEKSELDVIPRKEEIPIEKLDEIEDEIKIKDELPTKFNLKDKINIQVEDQESFGLCWAFASLKSLETNVALKKNKNYDFSEMHVDYLTSNLFYGSRTIHDGGSFEYFEDYLTVSGPILESTLKYKDYEDYKDFNTYKNILNVTKTISYPGIYKNDDVTQEEVNKFRKIVKNHIMQNGSLYASIDSHQINEEDEYTTEYCSDDCMRNHAISIVGWDDNYPKENFKDHKGKHPSQNGAYIALNSWGKEFGEDGYFYISYEDDLVEREMSGVISTDIEDAMDLDEIKNNKIREYIKETYGNLLITVNNKQYMTEVVLNKIEYLDLSNLGLTEEDLDDLSKFKNLWGLDLSHNKITNVNKLQDLKEISSLDLSYNKISNVDKLSSLPELYYLDVSHNDIEEIKLDNPELGELNLSGNNLNWENNIKFNDSLYKIDLSNTGLTNLNKIDCNGEYLDLNVSDNSIETIDGIEKLDVKILNISKINAKDFSKLNKISAISIIANDNNIDDISVFNDVDVSSLELKNNKLKDISEFNNSNIEYIDLSYNNIEKGIESLNKQQTVILSNCNINNLDEVSKLTNVSELDLSNNPIDDYRELSKLRNLTELSLENNKNIDLNDLSTKLEMLNVKNSELKNIDKLKDFDNLWLINLTGNIDEIDYSELQDYFKSNEYICILLDSIGIDKYEEMSSNDNMNIEVDEVIYEYNDTNIKLNYGDSLNKILLKKFLYLKNKDIVLNKDCLNIKITGQKPTLYESYFNLVFENKKES